MPAVSPRRWIAHTFAGWVAGVPLLLGLSMLFEAGGIQHANAPVGIGMGAGIGLLQARALRPAGVRGQAWATATIAGVALPFLLSDLARRLGLPLLYLVYPFAAIGGLLASLLQLRAWPGLRPRALGWIAASTAGWWLACSSVALADLLSHRLHWAGLPGALAYLGIACSGGLLLGLATAAMLPRLHPNRA